VSVPNIAIASDDGNVEQTPATVKHFAATEVPDGLNGDGVSPLVALRDDPIGNLVKDHGASDLGCGTQRPKSGHSTAERGQAKDASRATG
jgi:hypothetical protein